MGSTSAGAQGITFGASFGTTWTDEGCQARYDAEYLNALGLREAAIERLCLRDDIATAIEASGGVCKVRWEESGDQAANRRDRSLNTASAAQPSVYVN